MAKKGQEVPAVPELGVMESIGNLRSVNRGLLKSLFIVSGLLAVSVTGNIVQLITEKPPVYFGLTQEMSLLPMLPLSAPMVNDAALKSWAATAVSDMFNMDFVNWRERISNSRQYLTRKAFLGFAASLDKEGHLATIRQYRAVMHGVVSGPPVIVASGEVSGVRTWELEVPFSLSYETSAEVLSAQKFIVSLRVQRVSTAEYPKGIAISQLLITRTK